MKLRVQLAVPVPEVREQGVVFKFVLTLDREARGVSLLLQEIVRMTQVTSPCTCVF